MLHAPSFFAKVNAVEEESEKEKVGKNKNGARAVGFDGGMVRSKAFSKLSRASYDFEFFVL